MCGEPVNGRASGLENYLKVLFPPNDENAAEFLSKMGSPEDISNVE